MITARDKDILRSLQEDSTISQQDLAEKVGMSRSSCWRRIQELEASGVIRKSVAVVDGQSIGYQMLVFLAVAMTEHNEQTKRNFESHVSGLEQVMQCHSISGERDYLLQVVATDMENYDRFLNTHILCHPTVRSAASTFTLRQVKLETAYPV